MMTTHITKGQHGETLAAAYLKKCGFEVEHCNWRAGHYEIDIIATKDGMLHFIEVKTRHSLEFGFPEEGVSKKKFKNLKNAATIFLSNRPNVLKIQFDILSILRLPQKAVEYFLIEDVYL